MNEVIFELRNITKYFPGVVALKNMSLVAKKGMVHGVIGENGAGKSTLIKVLTGVNIPEKGEIFIDNKKVKIKNPKHAIELGVGCIYQELNIVPEMSITDNIFIADYPKKKHLVFLDKKKMQKKAEEVMSFLNCHVDIKTKCTYLGVGMQQMVEISKAVIADSRLIIMDEPTSSLSEAETKQLFLTIKTLKAQGISIIFISHKLEEMFEICDDITVMRDGELVRTTLTTETTKDQLISDMVGRDLSDLFPKEQGKLGEVFLEVKNMNSLGKFKDISFKAYAGEILGFSGLVGAGRTEVCRAICGADEYDSGEIYIKGELTAIKAPRDSIKKKVAFLTENRKEEGLILDATAVDNINITTIDQYSKYCFIDKKKRNQVTENQIKDLKIKIPDIVTNVGTLSGGNQQKIVIGKWINSNADIYIFDEPTRGIDVGAKIEVYHIMNKLVAEGKCVIMVSSELPEIIGMCDRVLVMREGKILAKVKRDSDLFNEETIMKAAWGGNIYE